MREIERITDQLRKAFAGNSWHGPSVREVLTGVSAAQAAARPLPPAHTIWEITLHIAAWKTIVRSRFLGEPAGEIPPEEDWPPVGETSEAAWHEALNHLDQAHQDLEEIAANLSDEVLEKPVVTGAPTGYVLLHGIIQHDLYHAGQIALLRKASASPSE